MLQNYFNCTNLKASEMNPYVKNKTEKKQWKQSVEIPIKRHNNFVDESFNSQMYEKNVRMWMKQTSVLQKKNRI